MRPVRVLSSIALLLLASCVPSGPASTSVTAKARVMPPPGGSAGRPVVEKAVQVADSPPLADGFEDNFDRPMLGPDWQSTGGAWKIEDGKLCGKGARNHPVWLNRALPTNARFEFDATTDSIEGDLKAEFFGDGLSAATGSTYNNATSYLTIFGGWKNSFHVLARINEHASDRPEIKVAPGSDDERARPVSPGQVYRFKVERADGRTIAWWIGDMLMFRFGDPQPLSGSGHDHFGFNDWEVRVCFDNVKVVPL